MVRTATRYVSMPFDDTLHNTTSHWIATNPEEKARILESDPDSLNGPAQYGDLIAGFYYSRILGAKTLSML